MGSGPKRFLLLFTILGKKVQNGFVGQPHDQQCCWATICFADQLVTALSGRVDLGAG